MLKDIQLDQELANTGSPLGRGLRRIIAATTIFFFFTTFYFIPTARAVESTIASNEANSQFQPHGDNDEARLSNTLQAVKESVGDTKATVDARVQDESGIIDAVLSLLGLSVLQNESLGKLQSMNEQVQALNDKALKNFAAIEIMLKEKNLPQEILQRHFDAVSKYETEYAKLQMYIQNCITAESLLGQQSALEELNGFLQEHQFKRRQQPFDPENLPFGDNSDKFETREPVQNKDQLSSLVNTNGDGIFSTNIADSVFSKAYAQTSSNQPSVEDLSENIDVVISPEIKAQATALNNDPIEIFNWVYNNVDYIPSFGSIQGSAMTLQNKQGNSFDISSLLIAMLRAAGTPARYAYGSAEIPVERVMNWVGGAATPEMAAETLGQSGIPNLAIVNAGKITHIRLEHIWVEAWIDFEPSRGIVNIDGDSWTPMDASFQQYEFSSGAELLANVPFEYNALEQDILDNAEVDENLGKIAGVSPFSINSFLDNYAASVESFAASQGVNSSFEELLGEQKIIRKVRMPLSAGLPYELLSKLDSFSEIPASFRLKLNIELVNDLPGGFGGIGFGLGNTALSYDINMPELNSKRLGITYKGASESDRQALESFQSNSGGSIGLYLLNVLPAITIDGVEVVAGSAGSMGANQTLRTTVRRGNSIVLSESFAVQAGDEMVLSAIGNSISEDLVGARRAAVEPDTAAEQLQQVALNYWMESDYFNQTAAKGVNGIVHRQLSIGVFASPLNVNYFFGLPRSGQYRFRTMDVARSSSVFAAPNAESRRNLIEQSGMSESFLEGAVFDQLFGRGGGGISAAQLIADANLSGIPIYYVDSANISDVLPLLQIDSDIRSEIIAAANAGKYIIIPERDQSRVNWRGTGYIIRDLQTGSGAYLISGGLAGGTGSPCDDASPLPLLAAIVLIIVVALVIAYFAPALVGGLVVGGAAAARMALAIRALIASMLTTAAAQPVYASLEDPCSCREAYSACLESGWGGTVSFGSACQACYDRCDDSGGSVNWPSGITIIGPGGIDLPVSCSYPGAP